MLLLRSSVETLWSRPRFKPYPKKGGVAISASMSITASHQKFWQRPRYELVGKHRA